MSETIQPVAEATATPAIDTTNAAQGGIPATEAAAVQPVEVPAEVEAEKKTDQLRDNEGKFLPKSPRVEKLQSTINELTRQKHDTAREVARLKAEAADLAKRLKDVPQLDPADFAGQTRHDIKQAIAETRLEETSRKIQTLEAQSQQASEGILAAQVDAMREHIPDIDAIFMSPAQGGPSITPVMAEAIARQENGALIAYHLMKNPREAARLCTADPFSQIAEIGRLSAHVKPAQVKRVSQAPQPVQTVSGSPGNPAPDLSTLNFSDYEKVMNEREMARRV